MMDRWKNLAWKKKNRILFGALFVCSWIVYSLAISNTIEARSRCLQLQTSIDSSRSAPEEITRLENELVSLKNSSGISNWNAGDTSVHEQLLDHVTHYCDEHSLRLREFQPPIRYRREEWLVETHPFTVEGSYINILLLLDELRTSGPGKVVSAGFFTKKDNKTKTVSLQATIYVQNLIGTDS